MQNHLSRYYIEDFTDIDNFTIRKMNADAATFSIVSVQGQIISGNDLAANSKEDLREMLSKALMEIRAEYEWDVQRCQNRLYQINLCIEKICEQG